MEAKCRWGSLHNHLGGILLDRINVGNLMFPMHIVDHLKPIGYTDNLVRPISFCGKYVQIVKEGN